MKEAIDSLKTEGYDFKQIDEVDIITLARKRDMTYGSYLKHNMSALEWKLNQIFIKDKTVKIIFLKFGGILITPNLINIVIIILTYRYNHMSIFMTYKWRVIKICLNHLHEFILLHQQKLVLM